METQTQNEASLTDSPGSARIIQLLITHNDSLWQGVLLGLGDDGVTYHCKTGHWEPYIPPLGYLPNAEVRGGERSTPQPKEDV